MPLRCLTIIGLDRFVQTHLKSYIWKLEKKIPESEGEQKRREIKQPEILQQARPCNFPAFRFEYSVTNSPSSMYFITRPLNSSSAWSTASV